MTQKNRELDDESWDKLCTSLYENNCILFLGSEFPIEVTRPDGTIASTNFSALLSEKIISKLRTFNIKSQNFEQKELSQLATDFINTGGNAARGDLEFLVRTNLGRITPNATSVQFSKLLGLPFHFIVDTNYSNFFFEQIKKINLIDEADGETTAKKTPEFSFYNFRGQNPAVIKTSGKLGTDERPFVYNLFGATRSQDEAGSIAISEYDLIELLSKIISKTPDLPKDVRAELVRPDTIFLFIGFGILIKSWYFRILLHTLESAKKKNFSYASECLSQSSEDPSVLFFKSPMMLELYYYDQIRFIDDLVSHYNAFVATQPVKKSSQLTDIPSTDDSRPRAFISYKSEDFDKVSALKEKLESKGIKTWMDKKDLRGEWRKKIVENIKSSNVFLLMQSQNLKLNPVSYVNVEYREAEERAKEYVREEDYFFPCYIDNKNSAIMDFELVEKIQNWDLSNDDVDELSVEIMEAYKRSKH